MFHDYMPHFIKVLKQESIVAVAFLFGSAATGRERPESDLDVAILLKNLPAAGPRLSLRLKLIQKLSSLSGRDVDVVFLNSAGSILKYQVSCNGKLLFERQKGSAKRFRLNSIKEYFDYLPTFNFHYERLKKGRANGRCGPCKKAA